MNIARAPSATPSSRLLASPPGRLAALADRLREAQVRTRPAARLASAPTPSALTLTDLLSYDVYIVCFSGGERTDPRAAPPPGCPRRPTRPHRVFWHHDVDGREGSTLMDWPCTHDYCRAVAAAFGVPIYYSWKIGGFEGEMLKDNAPTAGYLFETPDGIVSAGGKSNNLGKRLKFPATPPRGPQREMVLGLTRKSCRPKRRCATRSASTHRRTLVLTGERGEESKKRQSYAVFEADGHRPAERKNPADNQSLAARARVEGRGAVGPDRVVLGQPPPRVPPRLGPRLVHEVHLRQPRPVGLDPCDRPRRLPHDRGL